MDSDFGCTDLANIVRHNQIVGTGIAIPPKEIVAGTLNIYTQILLSSKIDSLLDVPHIANIHNIRRISICGAWALAVGKTTVVVIVLPVVADRIVSVPLGVVPRIFDARAGFEIVFWLLRMTGSGRCSW
jgi:hypothetical protein